MATAPRLRLDPWGIDYNTALNVDPQREPASDINLDVEQPAGAWRAISPQPQQPAWPHVLFLDGSRRLEARLHLEDGPEHLAYGALGTTAVGAVRTLPYAQDGARAQFEQLPRVRRWCLLSGDAQHDSIELLERANWPGQLTYVHRSFPETDPAAVIPALQGLMQNEERDLARQLLLHDEHQEALLVFDGSLPFQGGPRMVGYLKTFTEMRVGLPELQVVVQLERGQRSPLYHVQQRGSTHAYFEWFLRLRDPQAWHNTLAGMVRLQVYSGEQPARRLDFARSVADWSALHLPSFSTKAHQDPRAPQQLLPIRALEAELRRHMGNPLLLNRRMMTQFHNSGSATPDSGKDAERKVPQ